MRKLLVLPFITVLFICLSSPASAQIQPAAGLLFGVQGDTTGHNEPVGGLELHANLTPGPVRLGLGIFAGMTMVANQPLPNGFFNDLKNDAALTYGVTVPVSLRLYQANGVSTYLMFTYLRSLYVARNGQNFNAFMVGLTWGM